MIDVLMKSDNKSTKSLSTIPKYNATKGIIKKIFESLFKCESFHNYTRRNIIPPVQ